MRFWVGTVSAAAAGLITGIGVGILLVEDKLKKEYEESTAATRRAYEAALINAKTERIIDGPYATEDEVAVLSEPLGEGSVQISMGETEDDGTLMEDTVKVVDGTGKVIDFKEPSANPYHRSVAETSPHLYASYAELDEEEYMEEDGRVKDQITMIYTDGTPRFFNNGEEIDDALDRVGGSIVDDMRKAVNEGNPIIWVRNNKTDVDYEVIFEQP